MMEGEGGSNKEEAGPSHGGPTWYEEDKRMEEEEEGETEEDDHLQDSAAAAAAVDSTTTFVPGPLLSLKDQIEKDQDDESLRRWKEKLLGCLESDLNGQMEPEVKFHSVGILSSDFGEINTPLPIKEEQSKSVLFTLREGSEYRLKLTFSVLHNIVSGLAYTNTVWKAGLQGDTSFCRCVLPTRSSFSRYLSYSRHSQDPFQIPIDLLLTYFWPPKASPNILLVILLFFLKYLHIKNFATFCK
ncbi:rho GDP-dissociation inhibitor 1-like isoform X3 [Capsicum annuum]|uniref:rho GDP-dissociation inhibitor 1-like isoform X3 n=1 Tax=Capsicum annuum TaxID=4072 RepID=UPI001FB07D77|nr:rho GDP-dissociation inhibitor 1-like isoform X3 [Capsicum annuum]